MAATWSVSSFVTMRWHTSFLIAAALACRPAARPADAARGDSASAQSAGSTVCDSVATLWRATGRAQVRVIDTSMRVISDSVPQTGCFVQATAPQGLDSAQGAGLFWARDAHEGWTTLTQWDADGPMGSSRTLERADMRCQVDYEFEGDDDSDSTYVPSPAREETTFCWRMPAGGH